MDDAALGLVFAGHRLDEVAGRGGMGVVYRATDLALDRHVAVKLIAPALAGDPAFRRRFVSESKVAASLDHPNVIPIHHAGEQDGVLFQVMRYVEGEDLRAMLRREGRLEPERAAPIVAAVAAALDAAHARGLVHRDVKPANVLLGAGQHVYLTDFGLVKRAASNSSLTSSVYLMGSVHYMAPEHIEGKVIDGRAAELHCEPEVGQVDVAAGVEQHVGGLDVPVHEAARVRGVERGGHRGDDRRRQLGLEPALAAQQRAQVLALDVAHDLEQHAVLLARVVDRDDVRMVQRRGDLRLRDEAAAEGRITGERGRDQLDGHVPVEREVGRPVGALSARVAGREPRLMSTHLHQYIGACRLQDDLRAAALARAVPREPSPTTAPARFPRLRRHLHLPHVAGR